MLLLKNIITFKNLDTTVKCHFGRISDTEMFFIRENHIFHTGLHLPDNVLSPFISPAMSGKTGKGDHVVGSISGTVKTDKRVCMLLSMALMQAQVRKADINVIPFWRENLN